MQPAARWAAAPRRRAESALARRVHRGGHMDFVALGIVAVFFALSWGFVVLCERL